MMIQSAGGFRADVETVMVLGHPSELAEWLDAKWGLDLTGDEDAYPKTGALVVTRVQQRMVIVVSLTPKMEHLRTEVFKDI